MNNSFNNKTYHMKKYTMYIAMKKKAYTKKFISALIVKFVQSSQYSTK